MNRQDGPLATTLGFSLPLYTDVQITYPSATTEVYTFYSVGAAVASITLTYTDSTKASLSRAQRTF